MWAGFLLVAAAAFSQYLSYEVRVVNIEVPVRVFDGDQFVDHLTLDDFEVLEDGVPQKIEAAYLFKKTALERKEGKTAFKPEAARHFYVFFSLFEYDPRIPKALNHFFHNVIKPGDQLMVITPRSAYDMKKSLIEKTPADKIVERLTAMLKKDIQAGDSAYRSVLADLKRLSGVGGVQVINPDETLSDEMRAYGEGTPAEWLVKFRSDYETLEQLRSINESKLVDFAKSIKALGGNKIVFYFYQKEFVPTPPTGTVMGFMQNPATSSIASEVFELMNRKSTVNSDRVKKAFSDSSINVYFLYLTKNPADLPLDQIADGSADIFPVFDEIAKATGGYTTSSQNPEYLMQQASRAADNYYLLYYSPKVKTADGKFRTVTVRVKSGNYRVAHLAGYFATDVPIRPLAPEAANPELSKPEPAKPALQPETKPAAPKDEARAAEVMSLLEKTAVYCRNLEHAALNFVCNEDVVEKMFATRRAMDQYATDQAFSGNMEWSKNGSMEWGKNGVISREWIYDFQLIRQSGTTQEKRTLIAENGEKRKDENAELKTTRFRHRNVFLGPIGLLGERAQAKHTYQFVKEGMVDGEPALVIEATPREKTGTDLFGKAWVRARDGAVVRIEWEPASMENYAAIEQFSDRIGKTPQITFVSEYGFEKNGLRFPNVYDVTEAYKGLATTWGNVFSKTTVTYKDYKFFQVETAVDIR
jgi:hypothetical protein